MFAGSDVTRQET